MKPIQITGEIIAVALLATWIFTTIVIVKQAEINTEHRMRIERLEDMALGLNVPVTQTVKKGLGNGKETGF